MFVCRLTTEYSLSGYTTETDQFMCADSIEKLQVNARKAARTNILWQDLTEDNQNCVAVGQTLRTDTGAFGESYKVYVRIFRLDQEKWY